MSKLSFSPVDIKDIDRIYRYTSIYGEGCCQHSPVSMWSLSEKYGDEFCEKDGYLILHRSGLSDDEYRVYLAPMCENRPEAYQAILDDAHVYGKKVRFMTLTKKNADFVKETFPNKFDIRNERDLAEYIIAEETFAKFPGKFHARRRTEIRSFWNKYGSRTESALMTKDDLDEVRAYAREWLLANAESHDELALNKEMLCINKQIDHFDELGLSGTVIRIDGAIRGFCYGVALNDDYYDVLIEKGDRAFPGLYRVIRQESTRLNVSAFKYVNFEEDVGVPGLRRLKESYGPAFLIEKYIVTEK